MVVVCRQYDRLGFGWQPVDLSYLGAERTMPNCNVMSMAKASLEAGVRYLAGSLSPESTRVNAVSAGPIRTLAASGIKNFLKVLAADFCRFIPSPLDAR